MTTITFKLLIGPVNEVLIFRQLILKDWEPFIPFKSLRLFISAFFFGLLHIHHLSELPVATFYFSSGIILGALYLWKKNLILSSLSHILNNSVATIMMLFFS